MTVTATDAAGNSSTTTGTVHVDTEINVGIDSGQAGGDDIANAEEVTNGVTLTGTAEAGSQVQVSLAGATDYVTADADGNWSSTFASSQIAQGEYDATVTVIATDDAGNAASSSAILRIDTSTNVSMDTGMFVTPVNAEQLQNGVELDGTAEAGAVVLVTVDGVVRETVADENGHWMVTYEDGSLPEGTYNASANVEVTDIAGNTATTSATFLVDTEVTNPLIKSVTFADDDVTSLSISTDDQAFDFYALNPDGTATELSTTEFALSPEESLVVLNPSASDGTHLVIAATDDAGNTSDTLLVLDDNVTNTGTLEHNQIDGFNIEGIELDYASDANLTLTEDMIRDLSSTSDTVTVHGGSDDTVTIENAAKTTQTVDIEGETYDIYTVGDDGVTVVIDQDINVVI
ncbi:Ig-like domain-containing protein [Aliiruegeria lutimaris]|uniref:Bacterial Ig-like domain-containing protein n=1 Tax=Aliiruegeria lutimaris TaxID=571298 RepID=A0A1G8QIY7_9RHOB|nr:Ig-like domain-containing protein [Aliiruegeria lutimaris]SDJ04628.1 hypothetical protein SAMN04488026_101114 [Aliiruegeria lutimaris]